VYVNLKSMKYDGRAVVQTANTSENDSLPLKFLSDGREKSMKRSRLTTVRKRKSLTSPVPVFIAETTDQYRNAVCTQINPGSDVLLEIGCSNGMCTSMVYAQKRPRHTVAVDVDDGMLSQARNRCLGEGVDSGDDIEFINFDVLLSDWATLEKQLEIRLGDITMVSIDIGGNRNGSQVLSATETVLRRLPNIEVVILKSLDLANKYRLLENPTAVPTTRNFIQPNHGGQPESSQAQTSTLANEISKMSLKKKRRRERARANAASTTSVSNKE